MNYLYPIVAVVLLALPAIAYARNAAPADPGMIVKPPQTDPESIVVPPKNVDPGIARDTGKIDKKTRKKPRPKPMPLPRD